VLKGNKATNGICRECGTYRMVFHLQLMLQAFGVSGQRSISPNVKSWQGECGSSSDLTITPLRIDTETTNNPQ
jgi:hypothetical protein